MKTCEDCKYYKKNIYVAYCKKNNILFPNTEIQKCNNFKQKDMKYTKLKTNDLIKAYNNGCSDVKETLKNLYPDVEFGRKLPKTWKEYVKITGCGFLSVDITVYNGQMYTTNVGSVDSKYSALYKLEQLRDYYNDGWVADCKDNNEKKYVIYKIKNKIEKNYYYEINTFLSFKTKELRDTFLDNFKELIEQAEDLI